MVSIRMRYPHGVEITVDVRPENTDTVKRLMDALPFTSKVHRWGDEVYFDAPFHSSLEGDARAEMEVGEVAFWPDGDAVAVFFGRTPVSKDDKPRAYSPCNVIGRVHGDASALRRVDEGSSVEVLL